jgi:hypothetical protein
VLCNPSLGSQPDDVAKWRGSTVGKHGASGDTGGFVEAECRLSTRSDVPAIIDAIKARERRRQELRELLTREEMPTFTLGRFFSGILCPKGMASLTIPSWNQLHEWLTAMQQLPDSSGFAA